jgi:hypothetical protein
MQVWSHPSTNLKPIVEEHRWVGAGFAHPDFRWDPPCIEKIEQFGFVLPVMQL